MVSKRTSQQCLYHGQYVTSLCATRKYSRFYPFLPNLEDKYQRVQLSPPSLVQWYNMYDPIFSVIISSSPCRIVVQSTKVRVSTTPIPPRFLFHHSSIHTGGTNLIFQSSKVSLLPHERDGDVSVISIIYIIPGFSVDVRGFVGSF